MDPQLDEPDLRSYLGTISRRKWLVAAVTLVFFGAAAAMSFLADPEYQLRIQVQTRAPTSREGVIQAEFDRLAENELIYVGSGAMAREVERSYDGPLPLSEIHKVRARDLGDADNRVSNSVELSYVTSDPDEGANMLRIYAEVVRPRLGAPSHVEDPRPPRFAAALGTVFLLAATVALLVGAPGVAWVLALIVAALAGLAAVTGLCLGCEVWLFVARRRRVEVA
jgi:hypothetical protein